MPDTVSASEAAAKGWGVFRPPTPFVIRTQSDLQQAVSLLSANASFVVDVETDTALPKTNQISWIGFASHDRVFLIPMGHPRGKLLTPAFTEKRLPPEGERLVLKSGALSNAKKTYTVPATFADPGPQLRQDVVFDALQPLLFSDRWKIGHNIKFDLESIAKYYGGQIPPGPYVDTMLLTHVLDENLPKYDLKGLVMDWLQVPRNSDVRKKFYPNLGKIGVHTQPLDEVARYLAKDLWYASLYYRDHIAFLREDHPDLIKTLKLEMDLYPVLMSMEMHGIRIDIEALAAHRRALEAEHQALSEQIWDICGQEFEISNPTKKRRFLFDKPPLGQGLTPLAFTPKLHAEKVDTELLEFYAPTNELCALLLAWTEKDKVISTFIEGLTKKLVNERLHTSFNQHRTVTGRLSSSQPNLQQIPRNKTQGPGIRRTFISDPGTVLLCADYDQIELRCAAFLSQDPAMIRVFQQGVDIHAQAAATMYGITLEEVDDVQRQVGKTMNFGTLFGAGPTKIALTANCSIPEAQRFINRYYEGFAGLAAWKEKQVRGAKRRGSRKPGGQVPFTIIPPFGRQRRLPDLYSNDPGLKARAERQVVNAIVQGFAANIIKLAMIDLHEQLAGTDMHMMLNVHDELVTQVPVDEVDTATKLIVESMQGVRYNDEPILGTVPLAVKVGIGMNWAEAK